MRSPGWSASRTWCGPSAAPRQAPADRPHPFSRQNCAPWRAILSRKPVGWWTMTAGPTPAPERGGRGFSLGRWFGVPVRIDVSWFFIAFLITWSFYTLYSTRFPKLAEVVMLAIAAGNLGGLWYAAIGWFLYQAAGASA